MTLHEAIRFVLVEAGHGLTVPEITRIIGERRLYLRRDGNIPPASQVYVRIHNRPTVFDVDRSTYPLTIWLAGNGQPRQPHPSAGEKLQVKDELSEVIQVVDEWWWEGKIQARMVAYLADQGWSVTAAADTATRARGADILATLGTRRLIVEVKGYPSTRYRLGPNAGQEKRTNPRLQAKHWFAEALLSGILHKQANPDAEVALSFPDVERYRNLISRTEGAIRDLKLGVFLIPQSGSIKQLTSPA